MAHDGADYACYGAIPFRALRDRRLAGIPLALLGVIAAHDRFGRNGLACTASQSRLAKLVGCNREAINRAITLLDQLGYINCGLDAATERRRSYSVVYDNEADNAAFADGRAPRSGLQRARACAPQRTSPRGVKAPTKPTVSEAFRRKVEGEAREQGREPPAAKPKRNPSEIFAEIKRREAAEQEREACAPERTLKAAGCAPEHTCGDPAFQAQSPLDAGVPDPLQEAEYIPRSGNRSAEARFHGSKAQPPPNRTTVADDLKRRTTEFEQTGWKRANLAGNLGGRF